MFWNLTISIGGGRGAGSLELGKFAALRVGGLAEGGARGPALEPKGVAGCGGLVVGCIAPEGGGLVYGVPGLLRFRFWL